LHASVRLSLFPLPLFLTGVSVTVTGIPARVFAVNQRLPGQHRPADPDMRLVDRGEVIVAQAFGFGPGKGRRPQRNAFKFPDFLPIFPSHPRERGCSTASHAFWAWVSGIFYEPFFQSRLLAAMARFGFVRMPLDCVSEVVRIWC
jgi:hypothetical protein